MASSVTWRRVLWPVAVGLASISLLGLECQYEPIPDQRRGFDGDPCLSDGRCSCVPADGGACLDLLACSPVDNKCHRKCRLNDADPHFCSDCGVEARCQALDPSAVEGACVPALAEGETCSGTESCAGCLICAKEGTEAATCRRQCDRSIDGGPAGKAIPNDHPYCLYADREETGAFVRAECCLFGQRCLEVSGGGTTTDVCFGPLPGRPGGTCRPTGKCDNDAVCITGNPGQDIPNICYAAGGRDQPCKQNVTCNSGLTCISDPGFAPYPICRLNCDTDPAQCPACGAGYDCVQVENASPGEGVCIPAALEAQSCTGGGLCSRCLVCGGVEGGDGGALCRRPCLPDVDGGAQVGPNPDYCSEPDPADGTQFQSNCCPAGQQCLRFTSGTGAGCYTL